MRVDLAGKRALVCGASQGIGAAAARALAAAGARVALLARSADALAAVRAELPGSGHVTLAADLGDTVALGQRVDALVRDFGPIEILVCNGGGPKGGPVAQAASEEFTTAFAAHVLANATLARAVLPGMRAAGYGRIVNVISTSVKAPIPGLGVSNTIRAAVASWAKTLSLEVAAHGVTVNNVLPGYTRTQRLAALLDAAAKRTGESVATVEQTWRDAVPAKRFAEPEEVAAAIVFLASPLAGYVNGINLPVDGGRTPVL
jgi:3-oxoacyl-[acyl-carrier protein] reductase